MDWKENFDKNQELILSTSSNNEPHLNVVISLGFVDGKLLVADCQMDTTLKNLKFNNKICVYAKKRNYHIRLKGKVEIFDSGNYFDLCKEICDNLKPRNAILISIEEVFDLDKVKKVL